MSSTFSDKSTSDEEGYKEDVHSSLVTKICKVLKIIAAKAEDYPKSRSDKFETKEVPSISISKYLERIIKYSKIEKSTLITALIYIDRFCLTGRVVLEQHNMHKILFISIYESIKYNEDNHYKIDYYAAVGGMEIEEVISLEYEFLKMIQFRLFVDEEQFSKFEKFFEV